MAQNKVFSIVLNKEQQAKLNQSLAEKRDIFNLRSKINKPAKEVIEEEGENNE